VNGTGRAASDFAESVSVAGIVTAVSLFFVAMSRDDFFATCMTFGMTEPFQACGPPLGVWLARRVLREGRRYVASLLVPAGWIGVLAGQLTLPTQPLSTWGGPLQMRLPAVGWLVGWIFVPVLAATAMRRSRTELRALQIVGGVVAIALTGFVIVSLLVYFNPE